VIGPAGVADLDAIEEIERHSFPNPWPRATYEAELAREDARLIVARGGPAGLVVGFCNYRIIFPGPQGRTEIDSGAEGELCVHAIATHPDHRRAGTGGRLLGHALADGRALGCARATLEVRRRNAPAIALYQRAGFRGVHVRPRYYPDDEDALVMLCDLTVTPPSP
jgi:ribosomal-protein-alanine N-acetyltransferase